MAVALAAVIDESTAARSFGRPDADPIPDWNALLQGIHGGNAEQAKTIAAAGGLGRGGWPGSVVPKKK
jgi:hypothetical protein